MIKLLRSDFHRLFRSKLFYLGIIAVAVSVGSALINNIYYMGVMEDLQLPLDNLLFRGTSVIGFAITVFTCFFVGTEYSDGTMRNKLIVGNSRMTIYISHFITTTVAALIMMVVGSFTMLALATFWMGWFVASAAILVPQILCCLLAVVAINAFILMFAILIPSRTICVVVCLVIMMIMVNVLPTLLMDKLLNEPTIPEMSYTDDNGIVQIIPEKPNPNYVGGTKRIIMQFCYDMIPTTQMCQYSFGALPPNINLFPFYSLFFIVIFSTVGVLFFKQRDLK